VKVLESGALNVDIQHGKGICSSRPLTNGNGLRKQQKAGPKLKQTGRGIKKEIGVKRKREINIVFSEE
jgi:hypothetical protein